MGTPLSLDPKLRRLIDSLRKRIRRYVIVDSLLAVAAVLLGAFWLGLVLDYGPVWLGGTEMPPLARLILLLAVVAIVLTIVARLLIGRLRRPLPDDSLALLLERQHPHLGGRLVTTVQLHRSGRGHDSHAPQLLKQVHHEATEAIHQVDPARIFSWQPLLRKTMVVAPMLLATLTLLVLSPAAFGRAASRLTLWSNDPWPRRAQLEMVGVELPVVSARDEDAVAPMLVEFDDHVLQLPRGSSGTLRIRAQAETAEVPVVCTVYYRSDDGTRGQSNMRRIGRVVDGYQSFILDGPPLAGLSDSLTLSVRGLDARLDDFRIKAVTPPAITRMNVAVRYPDYLRPEAPSEFDLRTDYQAGLRLREGSEVVLTATSSVPLGETEVVLRTDSGEFEPAQWLPSDDRRQGQIVLDNFTRSTAVRIVPRDQQGISAQAPYRYFFGVITDEPPELQMRLRGIGTAVTAIAKMPLEVVATDDYGIESLEVAVTPLAATEESETAPADSAAEAASVSLPLQWDRDGRAATEIDLRPLAADQRLPQLAPGRVLNVIAEARDGYDLGQPHVTRSERFRLEIVTP
ncbi:MAG: polyketide synthase, partial [Novipirellula sp. JB048]